MILVAAFTMRFRTGENQYCGNHNGSSAQTQCAHILAAAITMRFAACHNHCFANHNGSNAQNVVRLGRRNNFIPHISVWGSSFLAAIPPDSARPPVPPSVPRSLPPSTHSLTHSLTHPLTHSLTHSLHTHTPRRRQRLSHSLTR